MIRITYVIIMIIIIIIIITIIIIIILVKNLKPKSLIKLLNEDPLRISLKPV
jgi:hypothetical protein